MKKKYCGLANTYLPIFGHVTENQTRNFFFTELYNQYQLFHYFTQKLVEMCRRLLKKTEIAYGFEQKLNIPFIKKVFRYVIVLLLLLF